MPAVELECPPPNAICSVCRVLEEAELWRCGDCGSDIYFCATCAVRTNKTPNIVHQLELWKSVQFIPCVPVGLRWKWRRQDDHDCELEPVTLIHYRLWPATPHLPQTAISVDLLRQFAALQLECGVSLRGITFP
ncbi:hypothetical protein J4Q44_G00276420 [Coregonus suidteri]|uniref:Uncharacterized protein n=1 Tax=Coregonus suidteri TaxID=861788 RepID=A0AAN8L585_9TELE